jgi:hypothetical protein
LFLLSIWCVDVVTVYLACGGGSGGGCGGFLILIIWVVLFYQKTCGVVVLLVTGAVMTDASYNRRGVWL